MSRQSCVETCCQSAIRRSCAYTVAMPPCDFNGAHGEGSCIVECWVPLWSTWKTAPLVREWERQNEKELERGWERWRIQYPIPGLMCHCRGIRLEKSAWLCSESSGMERSWLASSVTAIFPRSQKEKVLSSLFAFCHLTDSHETLSCFFNHSFCIGGANAKLCYSHLYITLNHFFSLDEHFNAWLTCLISVC